MTTPALRKKINEALQKLSPLFNLTQTEIDTARQFTIRRNLKNLPRFYAGSSEVVPAYSSLHSFFFFPVKDDFPEPIGTFSDIVIYHESSHHLHKIANPGLIKKVESLLRRSNAPREFSDLRELVAEYGNMILGLSDYSDNLSRQCHQDLIRIYPQYGPEFLPRLARMSLEEAIKEGIIKKY